MKDVTGIRLIACDLDGTLFNSRRETSKYNLDILQKAINKGYWVVPATGRPLVGITPELRKIPGLRYCVMCNGASIYDLKESKYLYRKFISKPAIEKIMKVAKEYDIAIAAVIDGRHKTTQEHLFRVMQKYPDPFFRKSYAMIRDISDDVMADIKKASYEVEKFNLDFFDSDLKEHCKKIFENMSDIEISCNADKYLEITALGCNKGTGLDILAKHLGVKNSQTMIIGDSDNDLSMFTEERFCVAMANADPSIKTKADYITDTNDRNGVGLAIERLLFGVMEATK